MSVLFCVLLLVPLCIRFFFLLCVFSWCVVVVGLSWTTQKYNSTNTTKPQPKKPSGTDACLVSLVVLLYVSCLFSCCVSGSWPV